MIEKLNWEICNTKDAFIKINELVDFANAILRDVARGYSSFSGVDFNNPPQQPEPADKYAKQRKWIGKLCKFWDNDNDKETFYTIGILNSINKEQPDPFDCLGGHDWKYCEPYCPNSDVVYKE